MIHLPETFYAECASGVSWRELQARYGFSMACLMKHARGAGIPHRNIYQTPHSLAGGYMTPWLSQNDDLERLICSGFSEREAAVELRRSYDGTRHQLRKLGYPTSNSTNTFLFMAMCRAGVRPNRCAELIGLCVGENRWPAFYEDLEIIRLYDQVGASNKEIAAHIGVGPRVIGRWRMEYQITKPRHGRMRPTHKDARSRMLPDGMGGIA